MGRMDEMMRSRRVIGAFVVIVAAWGPAASAFQLAGVGTGSVVGTGKASGQTTWLVGGFAYDLGTFSTKPTISKSLDLTRLRLSSVPVSITTTLSAYSTTSLGSATVSITGAELLVEVATK